MASTITALTGGGGVAVAGDTSGVLELKTDNGTTAMTIDTSQNVGIGGVPSERLSLSGQANIYASLLSTGGIKTQIFSSDATGGGGIGTVTNQFFATYTNNTERMRIAADGTITASNGNVLLVSGTAQASTSGTSIDFTGIPSWVKRITVMFSGVSLSGTDDILVQLGVSGNYTATYASTCAGIAGSGSNISTSTTGFVIRSAAAASITSGVMVVANVTGNVWVSSFSGKQSVTAVQAGGGDVSLSGVATSIRITTTGTNTFDAGTINIMYE